MRFLREVRIEQFRCHPAVDLVCDHVNIFAGPNNAGKSALVHALRRLASVDRERSVPGPSGTATVAPASLRVGAEDRSDSAGMTPVRLQLTPDLALVRQRLQWMSGNIRPAFDSDAKRGALATMASSVQKFERHDSAPVVVDVHFESQHGTIKEADPGRRDHLMWLLRAVEALPIVVIPEYRQPDWPLTLSLSPHRSAANAIGIREEVVEATQVLPTVVDWYCDADPWKGEFLDHASRIMGRQVLVRPMPRTSELLVAVGDVHFRSIENMGAGVLEALTLAMTITRYRGGLLLYEEPELHLHPTLQRRFVEYITSLCLNGQWQAILTTHSNHILDADTRNGISIYLVNEASRGEPRVHRVPLQGVLNTLGVRPSSLNEANAVVWVEGPSDVIYVRFFLARLASKLIEGRDFAFAFLSGSLLDHVALDDDAAAEALVNLCKLHPGSFVVIDSDRSLKGGPLGKKYAQRFVDGTDPGRSWVTSGREMENYLGDAVIDGASWWGKPLKRMKNSRFADVERRIHSAGGPERLDKVRFARAAVAYMAKAKDWVAPKDLRKQVARLATFIEGRGMPGAGAPSRMP